MSKWHKFAKQGGVNEEYTVHLTMHLRQIRQIDGDFRIEQLVEYRNQQNMVTHSEWIKIPSITEAISEPCS